MIFTERTNIDFVTMQDAAQISEYYVRNAAHLCSWEPARDENYHSVDAWQSRVLLQVRNRELGTAYHFLVRRNGDDIIGLCNFNDVMRGAFQACYLGYSIDRAHQGQVLMFEVLSAVIPFVMSEFGLHRIMANYMPANDRSGRLLNRLGFEREGYAKDYLKIAGVWQDHILMSRLAD